MDVDLLRPGTVPIPPDTILWFEFLLDPNLLKNHLSKPYTDPSAWDLIIKFSTMSSEPQQQQRNQEIQNMSNANHAGLNNNHRGIDLDSLPDSPPLSIVETERYTRKHLALKVLCLKVAAFLKWNLNAMESMLSPHIQFQLMQDLVYMATDGTHTSPPQNITDDVLQHSGVRFAMTLYHRWLLRFLVNRAHLARAPKQELALGAVSAEYAQAVFERLVRHSEESRKFSLQYLMELTDKKISEDHLKIPTLDSFIALTEDPIEMTHDWENAVYIVNEHEFLMQVNYDLCSNYFFYGQYDLAEKHILLCNQHKEKLVASKKDFNWSKMEYASVTEGEIQGYMNALNIKKDHNGLLHALQQSVLNNYSNLLSILQEDNVKREIPFVHRVVIELDIQGSSSSGVFTVSRDLINKIAALNAVRSIFEGHLPSCYIDFNKRMKHLGPKFMELLFWAFQSVLATPNLSQGDLIKIKSFFLHLATSEHVVSPEEINKFISLHINDKVKKECPMASQLFDNSEINEITQELSELNTLNDIPPELLTTDWETPDFDVRTDEDLKIGYLKQKLIDATSADKIRECLVSLALTKTSHPLWTANPQWKLPGPIQSVVLALPGGFQQDFSYILLGKARQFSEMGDHNAAIELLLILEGQLSPLGSNNAIIYKLCKLVGWEALYLQITQVLAEWPHHKANMTALVNKSNMCLIAANSSDSIQPRPEVREMCNMLLLNTCEWNSLVEGPARSSGPTEALAASAIVFQQATRSRNAKRMPKDLWDMVVPIFASNYYGNTNKRNSMGNPVYSQSNSRDNQQQNNKMKDGMVLFFAKLREPTVLTVVISLLARLFNILKDDSNWDLNMEFIHLWPSSVTTSTFFSAKAVSETLHHLLTQALSYYPNNISWIKLLGDINLVGGHYSAAMKQYLSALTIMSDNFIQPLSKQLVEDQTIFKRMIKCCTQLNCPTQAAILCQFLDEIDYGLAFKCLAEMSHLCSDAMDSYYGCIWDITILEYLINLHHKRGETHRKQLAVKVMGMLELNSNNNEEIQREAANSRKAKFMRALVRQYMC